MGQIRIPIDTELCTVVWDYGFPVRFRNRWGALLRPIWLLDVAGVVWLHCSCGWSSDGLGRHVGGFLWGL